MKRLKIRGENELPSRTTSSMAMYLEWKSFVILDKQKSLYDILTKQLISSGMQW